MNLESLYYIFALMYDDDRKIVELFVKNPKEGIRMLFERYYQALVVYARSLINDAGMAEDIVQDFFVRLWEEGYLKNIDSQALNAYLFASIKNKCYTYRCKKDVLRVPVDYTTIDVAAEAAEALDEEVVEKVVAIIENMPEQTRNVLNCILMQEMKYQETADRLQISINTVKTLLRKGMRTLRNELHENKGNLLLFLLSKRFGYSLL